MKSSANLAHHSLLHGKIQYMKKLKHHYGEIIKDIGEDETREGLVKTPERAAKALQFLTYGYETSLDEIVNGAIFQSNMNEMVIVKNIEFYSLCEHHLLPFFGCGHVAYIPKGKIIGLSKIPRIIDRFARRLQVQENLTQQIGECLMDILQPSGVGVVLEAHHLCMMMRGVEKQSSTTTTSVMLGTFKENASTRAEFLSLLKNSGS